MLMYWLVLLTKQALLNDLLLPLWCVCNTAGCQYCLASKQRVQIANFTCTGSSLFVSKCTLLTVHAPPEATCAVQVELIMPVIGANGRVAHAQVQSSGESQMDIQVQLPNGRLIRIDPNEGAYDDDDDSDGPSQKGRVIDVDWREVR